MIISPQLGGGGSDHIPPAWDIEVVVVTILKGLVHDQVYQSSVIGCHTQQLLSSPMPGVVALVSKEKPFSPHVMETVTTFSPV